jgi:hypothetical protein
MIFLDYYFVRWDEVSRPSEDYKPVWKPVSWLALLMASPVWTPAS